MGFYNGAVKGLPFHITMVFVCVLASVSVCVCVRAHVTCMKKEAFNMGTKGRGYGLYMPLGDI